MNSVLPFPIFEVLSALALRQGLRISGRELEAQTSQFDDENLTLLSAAQALQRQGMQVRVGAISPMAFDPQQGDLVVGHRTLGAVLLTGRAGNSLRCAQRSGPDESVGADELQTQWTGWSCQARLTRSQELEDGGAQAPWRMHWFWSVFATLRVYYLDSTVAAVLINFLALASSMFSMNVYDRVIPNAAMHSLWVLAIGVTLAGLLELGLRTLRGYLVDVAGKKADLMLSARLFRQILNLRAQDRPGSSGQFAGQVRDFESVRDFVSSTTLVALSDLPFALLFIVVIGFLGGPLVWVPIVGAVLVLLAGWVSQWPIRQSIERYQYESAQKLGFMVEALEKLEQLRAMGAEPSIQARWERLSATTARSAMGSRLASAVALNFTQFVQQASNTGMIIWGVYLILEGRMTVGALIGCTILAGRVLGPLGQVAGLLSRYQHAVGAFKSMDRVMKLTGEFESDRSYLGLSAARGEYSVQHLQFSYPQTQRVVLRVSDLTIGSGDRVALMGPVGSGKSTLLKLLAWLYPPTQGHLLLDGLDMAQISPADLRAQIAWVGQDAVLFRATLRDNLLMAAPHVTDDRLQHILRVTGIAALAAQHPMGLDMPLGENGASLSGGQRQMVALARALLCNAPVLLMDEPTSAFDAQGEQKLLDALQVELQGKTVVLATHRPGPLVLVNRIVLLDAGHVLADGPRDAVLQAVQEGRVRRAQLGGAA